MNVTPFRALCCASTLSLLTTVSSLSKASPVIASAVSSCQSTSAVNTATQQTRQLNIDLATLHRLNRAAPQSLKRATVNTHGAEEATALRQINGRLVLTASPKLHCP